ncbi:hypothetical protein [Arthrobacter agilis]|uniref:hypothetical protein n=1 Tax=Arthrobacter agilis TaxID=37921 RepID=UPI00195C02B6|nr:hypothetical protein [Arthrobacter agilis]
MADSAGAGVADSAGAGVAEGAAVALDDLVAGTGAASGAVPEVVTQPARSGAVAARART